MMVTTGRSKLGDHSDDERAIAHNSAIAGLSVYENAKDVRCVELKVKRPKRKAE
jgi:hypothetical protein